MVRRQRGADLVVGDDRQVHQEAEHTGAQEVPEAHGHQEHDRPAVRERGAGPGLLA